jgi:hypothetical protein
MLNLRLDAGFSAASLINVPSFYGTGLIRLKPGDPDNSFLIHKLEGTQAFGQRMPLNGINGSGTYFQQTTIDVIRQWIQSCSMATCP